MKPKSSSGKKQALGLCLLGAMASTSHAQIQTAGDLLVDLNFTTLTPGDLPFVANAGTLGGGFEAFGGAATIPSVRTVPFSTIKSLYMDGGDFMMSVTGATAVGGTPSRMNAPAGLIGPQPSRSVEVWVYNESLLDEETVLAWGKRGGGDGQNYSCLYGYNPTWGALGQWGGPDLGWAGAVPPTAGTWHHLTYVHTGPDTEGGGADPNNTLVYVDGVLNTSENAGALNTHPGPMVLGAQMADSTVVEPANRGAMFLAKVRIHDGALTASQVANNYAFESAGFPATTPTALAPKTGPIHQWKFSESAGTKVADVAGSYHGTVRGAGSSWTGGSLALPGGGSGTQAYVDLPNRLLSSHAPELGGSGEVTLEMWVTVTAAQNWGRIFDFGSTNGNEITGPGGAGDGWDYLFLSGQEGTNTARNVLSLRHRDPAGNGPLGAGGPADVNPSFTYDTGSFGTQRHLTVVWKDKQELHLYEDGQPTRELRPGDIKMVQLNDVNCWLGRSTWLGDANLAGELNEFRIYDRALTSAEVLQNRADGPDVALPAPPDDDNDGLPNWFERRHASATMDYTVTGSPSQATLNGDTDSLTNLQEFQNGTNPLVADTDADGLDDGQEVTRGTNPLITDTDGDGLTDGAEVNTYMSNPLAVDTDSDGYTDAQEVAGGSNPANANSIPVVFLVARYSFNNPDGPAADNSTVTDSISGLNGYVRGSDATWTAGGLSLPGGPSNTAAYVDLPNNMMSRFAKANGGRGAVTMEGWVTIPTNGSLVWQRIIDFGSSAPGMNLGEIFRPGRTTNSFADGLDYFFLSASRGTATAQRRVDWTNNDRFGGLGGGGGADFDASLNTTDVPFHFAVTIDENNGKVFYYENGVQVATFDTSLKLEALNDVNCWLGRSNWTNDSNMLGTFDEFRVYAGALSAADVLKAYNKGAATLPNGANPATDITTLKVMNASGWPEWWVDRNPSLPAPGSDTDTDGLTALQELGRGSNPALADTDSDGLSDSVESNTGFFVSATNSGSNPAQADTDHDGLTDNLEVSATTDLFDPDTDNDLAFDGQDSNPTSAVANIFAPAHRWPFNDLPASIDADTLSADVAGGATFDAVIRGTGATSDGTGVNLPGGNNLDTTPYVDLPNSLISPQRAVTLVGWVTVNGTGSNWARFFDFGNSNNSEVPPAGIGNGTDYFTYTMQRGTDANAQRFTIREEPLGETLFDPNTVTTIGQEIFYAATVDSSAGNCGVFNLYRDGEWILQSAGSRYPLSGITDVNNWLGRSQYGGDTNLNGVYNEFRIYNGVLNAAAVKTIYNSGPDNTFHITDSVDAGAELQLTWNSRPNLTYTIESSPDLNTWSVANGNIPSAGFTTSGSVPKGTGRLFFRVRLDE